MGMNKFLLLIKLKIQFHGFAISALNGEEIDGTFYDKKLQNTNKKILE